MGKNEFSLFMGSSKEKENPSPCKILVLQFINLQKAWLVVASRCISKQHSAAWILSAVCRALISTHAHMHGTHLQAHRHGEHAGGVNESACCLCSFVLLAHISASFPPFALPKRTDAHRGKHDLQAQLFPTPVEAAFPVPLPLPLRATPAFSNVATTQFQCCGCVQIPWLPHKHQCSLWLSFSPFLIVLFLTIASCGCPDYCCHGNGGEGPVAGGFGDNLE